jgi:hypothetical protein
MEISSVPGHGSTFTCHFAPAQVARPGDHQCQADCQQH